MEVGIRMQIMNHVIDISSHLLAPLPEVEISLKIINHDLLMEGNFAVTFERVIHTTRFIEKFNERNAEDRLGENRNHITVPIKDGWAWVFFDRHFALRYLKSEGE